MDSITTPPLRYKTLSTLYTKVAGCLRAERTFLDTTKPSKYFARGYLELYLRVSLKADHLEIECVDSLGSGSMLGTPMGRLPRELVPELIALISKVYHYDANPFPQENQRSYLESVTG